DVEMPLRDKPPPDLVWIDRQIYGPIIRKRDGRMVDEGIGCRADIEVARLRHVDGSDQKVFIPGVGEGEGPFIANPFEPGTGAEVVDHRNTLGNKDFGVIGRDDAVLPRGSVGPGAAMDCDICRLRGVDELLYSRASRGHQHARLEFFRREAFLTKDSDHWN